MRLVSAGEFTMGSNENNDDEKPAHSVNVKAFYMDVYEVSNDLYRVCVDSGACTAPEEDTPYFGDPYYWDYPVTVVSWAQADAYCAWRGGRLPTEAEWEKAARGTDGRIFPWGDEIDGIRLNYCDINSSEILANTNLNDGFNIAAPVGSFENGISPYGLYDMAGIVAEWVADWYDPSYYQLSPLSDPNGPGTGQHRVIRGADGIQLSTSYAPPFVKVANQRSDLRMLAFDALLQLNQTSEHLL